MRLKRIFIIGTIFPVLFSIVLFFGILISGEDDDSSNSYSTVYSGMNLSADVLKHQPMVEKYARESGITEYVNVLLAIIQVESGGTATDVMQSSESLGLPPNSLSTEKSIKQGCINVNIKMYIFDHLRMYIFAILPLDRYIFLSDKIFL